MINQSFFACHIQVLKLPSLLLVVAVFFGCLLTPVRAQDDWQNPDPAWLQEVMPAANSFSSKQGEPPVYSAYVAIPDSSDTQLIGYVFTTPDLPPEEIGFSAPIDMLIGMDLEGTITGVKVLDYVESYRYIRGEFIEDANFANQFSNKSVEEEFRVNRDIDGMATATITSWAMARGVRNAARRVATAYLADLDFVTSRNQELNTLQWLQDQTWDDLVASGFVRSFPVSLDAIGEQLEFFVAFMGHSDNAMGEILLGASDYSNLQDELNFRNADGYLILIGLIGNPLRVREDRIVIRQNGEVFPGSLSTVVYAGSALDGKIAGQFNRSLAMLVNPEVDITQTFSVNYDLSSSDGEYTDLQGIDYLVAQVLLNPPSNLSLSDEQTGNITAESSQSQEPTMGWLHPAIVLPFLALLTVTIALRIRNLRAKQS